MGVTWRAKGQEQVISLAPAAAQPGHSAEGSRRRHEGQERNIGMYGEKGDSRWDEEGNQREAGDRRTKIGGWIRTSALANSLLLSLDLKTFALGHT